MSGTAGALAVWPISISAVGNYVELQTALDNVLTMKTTYFEFIACGLEHCELISSTTRSAKTERKRYRHQIVTHSNRRIPQWDNFPWS